MILFLKAHNPGYMRQSGVHVAPFDDKRAAKKVKGTPLPDHLKDKLFLVRHPGLLSHHRISRVRSVEEAAWQFDTPAHLDGRAVLVHAETPDAAGDVAFAWDHKEPTEHGKPTKEEFHEGDKHSFGYVRAV